MSTKTKNKSKNEVSIVNLDTFTVENIPALLAKVNESIKSIQGVDSEEEGTAGKELPGFGQLKSINDTTILIQAYSSVVGKEKFYNEAAEEMGLTKVPPFKIAGVTADKWKNAIIRREKIASSSIKLESLNKMKTLLTERLSEEDKMKNTFSEFSDLLSEL